jgi:pimeloyl-ACP methyl ester carboxylesterase
MKAKSNLRRWVYVNILILLSTAFTIHARGQNTISPDVKSFTINIKPEAIHGLKARLAATQWPDEVSGAAWEYGTNLSYMKELAQYWQNQFDWKAQESKLNRFKQFSVTINGYTIHFLYEKGKGSTSTPLILLHGWPSSFIQMVKIIPMLTAADTEGHSFDVIVPSLIGYGFSGRATEKGMTVYQMAGLFNTLMTEKLGYEKFMLRGSDIGAGIAKEWAISHPSRVMGLHLSGSNPYVYQIPQDLSEAEKKHIEKSQQFMMAEGAYAMLQSTKPQTLAFALNDSPVGLAAWIAEKYNTWSDNSGKLETIFPKDDLLTIISLYWFTQTIGSSMRLYYESAHAWSPNANKKVQIPTAFLMLRQDIAVAPQEWENRTYHIVRWHTHPRGGHFGEWEEPAAIAEDIKAFRKELK